MKKFIVPVLIPFLLHCNREDKKSPEAPLNNEAGKPAELNSGDDSSDKGVQTSDPVLDPTKSNALVVNFQGKVGAEDLLCFNQSDEPLQRGQIFTDVRFFVTNLTLIDDQGKEVPLQLDVAENSNNLQYVDANKNSLALLNFLDSKCASSDATRQVKTALQGQQAQGQYKQIRFVLGLPYPAYADELTSIPAALAPSDMGWMWEHLPADIQIEMNTGKAKKILNSLASTTKRQITLPVDFVHSNAGNSNITINLDFARLFPTTAAAFVDGIESACNNKDKAITEAAPNCAHAFKALGLEVVNPKQPYEQTLFSIVK